MNPRVLELIKNPKNIQSEDLGLLKEEIHAFPYIQNIRALHLYGVHLYEKENYQKELSTTAAYTTDKKILYQLINGKIQQEVKPEVTENKPSVISAEKPVRYNYNVKGFPIRREENNVPEKDQSVENEACLLQTAEDVKHIYVNGERNRILFEGEENFLEEVNTETIDLESTLESGTLVTQKNEPEIVEPVLENHVEEIQHEIEENADDDFTKETVINEDHIASEDVVENIEEDKNLSFEETEALLPEVEIEENITEVSTEDAEAIANEEISVPEIAEEITAEPEAELSFHGTDAFLPDVIIQGNNEELVEAVEAPTLNVNKHEEEMRRLIEEVEKKMKETKPAVQEQEVESQASEDHEISFAETQNFHFWSTEQEDTAQQQDVGEEDTHVEEEIAENAESEAEVITEETEEENTPDVQSAWKPMSLESNVPDSLINKTVETAASDIKTTAETEVAPVEEKIENKEPEAIIENSAEVIETPVEDLQESSDEQSENKEEVQEIPASDHKEDVPVMNVSFFGTDISSLKVGEAEKKAEEPLKEEPAESASQSPIDSNVPGFINTWQSWLKIGRTEEVEKEKEEIKEKAIETFIENNPRISQLKEESTYVVKEKNDDISHLMTETLAKLYFEQKLYSKAIKAFEILIKKHPEKKEYFTTRIKEIKEFRSKN